MRKALETLAVCDYAKHADALAFTLWIRATARAALGLEPDQLRDSGRAFNGRMQEQERRRQLEALGIDATGVRASDAAAHVVTFTAEDGRYVARCSCGWLHRWKPSGRVDVARAAGIFLASGLEHTADPDGTWVGQPAPATADVGGG